MFQIALDCQKCPSQEKVNVCPEKMALDASFAAIENEAPGDSPASLRESELATAQNAASSSEAGYSPLQALPDPKTSFLPEARDDRSTLTSLEISPFSRAFLFILLAIHCLAQTPGIGSGWGTQPLTAFEISHQGVVAHKGGLRFS